MSLKLSASSSPRIRLLVSFISKLIAGLKTEDEAYRLKKNELSYVINAIRITSVGLMLTAKAATSEIKRKKDLNAETDEIREKLKANLKKKKGYIKSLKNHAELLKKSILKEKKKKILKSKLTQKNISVLIKKNC
jgi:uncharacterized protein YbaP (TraB family)